jgi:hypothetical protein
VDEWRIRAGLMIDIFHVLDRQLRGLYVWAAYFLERRVLEFWERVSGSHSTWISSTHTIQENLANKHESVQLRCGCPDLRLLALHLLGHVHRLRVH